MRYLLFAVTAAVALVVPAAATALDLRTDAATTERHLVGFFNDPGLNEGDLYMGERVVAVDRDLVFVVVETTSVDVLRAKAALDDNVRYLEPDASDHQLQYTPNDPRYADAGHYGVKVTKTNLAWDTTRGSTAVKVAMIDSGLRKTHEDVAGSRVLQGYDFKNSDTNPEDTSGCSYHGTHTTGTALATINNGKGMAGVSQSMILPVKIFHPSFFGCGTTTTAIVNALKYAGDQGAHVSSNSWGGGSASTSINDAIKYAHNKGTNHVAAAGNSGSCTNCVGEPWKSNPTITVIVSCSDSADKFCSFSSQGPQVDVIAPGYNILSLSGSGDTSYKQLSGTSMSCPHVAGVMALIETRYPGASFATVEGKIKNSADNIGLISDRQGAGRLDGQGAIV